MHLKLRKTLELLRTSKFIIITLNLKHSQYDQFSNKALFPSIVNKRLINLLINSSFQYRHCLTTPNFSALRVSHIRMNMGSVKGGHYSLALRIFQSFSLILKSLLRNGEDEKEVFGFGGIQVLSGIFVFYFLYQGKFSRIRNEMRKFRNESFKKDQRVIYFPNIEQDHENQFFLPFKFRYCNILNQRSILMLEIFLIDEKTASFSLLQKNFTFSQKHTQT